MTLKIQQVTDRLGLVIADNKLLYTR